MQIILSQHEINEAVINHISRQLTVADTMTISVSLGSPRGSTDIQAIISLVPTVSVEPPKSIVEPIATVEVEATPVEEVKPKSLFGGLVAPKNS